MSDALKTDRSAKDFFFPQTQNLMEFKVDGKNIEVVDNREESEDFVVFGVRGCDVKSLQVLDKVFLAEPVDSYYANRREHGIIVSMACDRPVETCFCQTFGVDASAPDGDIVCYKTKDAFYLDIILIYAQFYRYNYNDYYPKSLAQSYQIISLLYQAPVLL